MRKGSPFGGNGDDHRQRRKQGGAVGAAASRTQATAKQTLGAATRPWRAAPERARPLTRNRRHSDSIALTEGLLIAAWQLCPAGLALSVCFAATSPIGRGTGVPVRPTRDEQSLLYPETVVPCYRDSRQLDKVLLSRSRCPRKRGPSFCVLSGLRRPAESGPARQWLPLWGQRRRPPPAAETGRSCWGSGQQDASDSEADAGSRNPALARSA